MTLAPYLLALTFGLLISALLHFVLVWPAREPAEDGDGAAGPSGDAAATAPGDAAATAGAAVTTAPARRRRTSRRRR